MSTTGIRTNKLSREIELTLRKLAELHPYMTLKELSQLQAEVIDYRNRAIIYEDKSIKRITVKPNEAKPQVPSDANDISNNDNPDDVSDF